MKKRMKPETGNLKEPEVLFRIWQSIPISIDKELLQCLIEKLMAHGIAESKASMIITDAVWEGYNSGCHDFVGMPDLWPSPPKSLTQAYISTVTP